MSYDTTEVLKEFDEAFVPAYYLRGNHKKAKESLSRALQKAYEAGEAHGAVKERERIAADLEIINTSVGEGIEVPVLGSKKMRRFIDSPEKLKSYFEALQGEKKESDL